MGVDRGLVRAFGYFSFAVVAVSAGGAGAVALATGNRDAILLFMPMLIGYGLVVVGLWGGLALYFRLRARPQLHSAVDTPGDH